MAVFRNQATITIGDTTTNSNVVTGEITTGITLSKLVLSEDYGLGDTVTYAVSIVNAGTTPYNNLTLTDNLGSFTLPGGPVIAPLDYVDGSLLYFVNGVLSADVPTVAPGIPLVITGINVPASGNALIVYEGRVNAFAPLAAGSFINNTVTVAAIEGLTDSQTVTVREEAKLSIAKSICPEVVTDGELTYTFVIQNAGNVPVIATDNLLVTDVFDPILTNITVTIDGIEQVAGVGYTYDEATGNFATTNGALTVPAATYVRDPVTGAITTTPGSTVITVRGTVVG